MSIKEFGDILPPGNDIVPVSKSNTYPLAYVCVLNSTKILAPIHNHGIGFLNPASEFRPNK
jgi:hypothetical protein